MDENPLISVVTPSFNHEDYVVHFINSLISQTYKNWELIIVDDCSADKTVDEIKKFSDSRIHLFIQDFNQGPGAALNKAFSESHGEIIVDMASDDMLSPGYFEYIVKTFSEKPEVGVIYSSLDVIDEKNRVYKKNILSEAKTRIELLRDLFYKGNILPSPGMATRRKFFSSLIPMDASMVQHQDYQWHISLLALTDCVCCSTPYVMYRSVKRNRVSLGAPSKRELNRSTLETEKLLDSFLQIEDLNTIKQITGSNPADNIPRECYKFLWANKAIKSKRPDIRQWGYKKICECFSDDFIRKKLWKAIHFDFASLLRMAEIDYLPRCTYLKKSISLLVSRLFSVF